MATKLDLHRTIEPNATPLAHKKLDICLSCEHITEQNRCGLMESDCFITAIVQWEWKACPLDKFPYDEEAAAQEYLKEQEKLSYRNVRKVWYPPIEDFLDAWVKNDTQALDEYRAKCLEVKQRFPKPE